MAEDSEEESEMQEISRQNLLSLNSKYSKEN
jgi:hypothetical protein